MCNCNVDREIENAKVKSRNDIVNKVNQINSQEGLRIIEIVVNAALKSELKD